jgi:hypothetical protein
MKLNLYIKALEIGFNVEDTGISFDEMKKKLNSHEYKFVDNLFRDWFYRNFEHKQRSRVLDNPAQEVSIDIDDESLRLSSESLFQYLEYLELQEARRNSKSAKKQSLFAIVIALVSLLPNFWSVTMDKIQKVSVEYVPEHFEKSIKRSIDSQLKTNRLLIEIKSKQDGIINTMNLKSKLKN